MVEENPRVTVKDLSECLRAPKVVIYVSAIQKYRAIMLLMEWHHGGKHGSPLK